MNYIDKLIIYYYQFLNRLIQNKVKLFIYLIIIFIFLYLGYFIYTKYIKENIINEHKLNYEFIDNNKKNGTTIVFWYTNWCPHCAKSKIEWKNFTTYLDNNEKDKYKNFIISRHEIDCDKQENLAKDFGIDKFPTITLFHKTKVSKETIIEYDALIKKEHLILFIDTFLEIDSEIDNSNDIE